MNLKRILSVICALFTAGFLFTGCGETGVGEPEPVDDSTQSESDEGSE